MSRIDNMAMMHIAKAHVDAMNNPTHPLANDPITAFLQDAADNSPHVTDDNSLLKAIADHLEATDDPNHPLAGHDMTNVLSSFRDALSGNMPGMPSHLVPQMTPMSPPMSPGLQPSQAQPQQAPQQPQAQGDMSDLATVLSRVMKSPSPSGAYSNGPSASTSSTMDGVRQALSRLGRG